MRTTALLSAFVLFLSLGCGSGDFPVAPTTGIVLCEGKPVALVQVYFEPLGTAKSPYVGKQGLAVTDSKGRFVLSTYGANDGAVIGRHRVRVGPSGDTPPDFKCDCALDSEVDVAQVEVTSGGKNEFEITLKKKVASEQKSLEQLEAEEEARDKARIEASGKAPK